MSKQFWRLYLAVFVFSVNLFLEAGAATDMLDVVALQDFKIQGLNLTGTLGGQLDNLHNLKHLDVSSNKILGEIPPRLPPNATHINLACNNLTRYIPQSLSFLTYLRHLNLSHNLLSGPVGNVFSGLKNLKEMDLSYNNFTGDLPDSFESLKNLTKLFLHNNKFTGSVVYLAELPLTDLNIEDNHFSGLIPEQFRSIPNLWIWGNKFDIASNYPPWTFPLVNVPILQNISGPPSTQSSAIEDYPSPEVSGANKKRLSPGAIGSTVSGVILVVTGAALLFAIHIKRSRAQRLNSLDSTGNRLHSLPDNAARDEALQFSSISPSSALATRHILPVQPTGPDKMCKRRKSLVKQHNMTRIANAYTLAELQLATNSFSEENLVAEGSLGSVYKAEFPDGHVVAVKNINMVSLSFCEEEQFMDVIRRASQLRHPNIITLLGYCVENGQHLIVYEYVRNFSLDDALHNEAHKPLPWGLRLCIALGIARALNYLHSKFSPPVAHCTIKSANILLDEELMPRICDSGLAILRSFMSNSVKLKASEIAIADTGYVAPEHGQPGSDNTKSDVYAFGVLLLELLTGRRPFDSSRPEWEQSLVKWASLQLHDSTCLDQMVDPRIRETFSSRALSGFADIISLCIQTVMEFRPQMSEIVEYLTSLLQKLGMENGSLAAGTEVDIWEKSFGSTYTGFISSPPMSPQSASFSFIAA
ncbi:hypothetical protein SLEP1_g35189 [Rubroshorea leprosula]|uniref:Protein kinase domain-containing protein n=1 Tax=Rubroshorea leprosula TaxID=152421 RepID=A0AAV5KMR1_9ROSI|nr:hypothetical protein SLEP1_g35189 [Rubroshorea leprosula]